MLKSVCALRAKNLHSRHVYMAPNIIDTLYIDTSTLLRQLGDRGDLSLQSFANSTLRKVLILSAASWFEVRICEAMRQFAIIHSAGHPGVEGLIKRKAIDRQYHTYFDWNNRKPGPFFALFGEKYGNQIKELINEDAKLRESLASFLELGNLRNELVHENFAAFPFEKTADEVYELFQLSEAFVAFVEKNLIDPKLGR